MGDTVYSFPREFQEGILALVLHDKAFLLGFRKAIDASYFTEADIGHVVDGALTIFDKAKSAPGLGSLLAVSLEEPPPGTDPEEIERLIRRSFKRGLPEDAPFIRDKVIDFGKHQRLQAALAESGEYLALHDFGKVVDLVSDAAVLTADAATPYYDYAAEVDHRIDSYQETLEGCIPTGIRAVDRHLQGGGLGPGEMGVFIGLKGGHKTTMLCNIGFHALRTGRNVLHATFEVSSVKTARRYDCMVTGMPLSSVLVKPTTTKKKLHAWLQEKKSKLIIQWWPKRQCTISGLADYIQWLRLKKGFVPDVLIADYVTKMRPEKEYDARMTRLAVADLHTDFCSLVGSLQIPGWTAIQANRESFKRLDEDDVITSENMAESLEPARDADLIITLNQTKEERKRGRLRLYGDKVRDGPGEWIEKVDIAADRYTVTDLPDDDEEEGQSEPEEKKKYKAPPPEEDEESPL